MLSNCGIREDSWVSWTARRSNQSILKEISPECSLKGLMLKLKLQYFGHLMQRADSLEKTLVLGMIEGRRRRGWDGWMASLTQWTWTWASSGSWWRTGKPGVPHSMGLRRVEYNWVTEQQQIKTGLMPHVPVQSFLEALSPSRPSHFEDYCIRSFF